MQGCIRLIVVLFASAAVRPGFAATSLAAAEVRVVASANGATFDGVVEALRQTTVAAQISGEVVDIEVRPGDAVKAGQVLVRIDSRAADQAATASAAQVQAGKAALEVDNREFERQRQLFADQVISQAALDRATAQMKSSKAQSEALIAQAAASRTQSGFYLIKAPYAGIIATVTAMPGDTALPGRPLLTMYDPAALRITVPVPQTDASTLTTVARERIGIELPGMIGNDREYGSGCACAHSDPADG